MELMPFLLDREKDFRDTTTMVAIQENQSVEPDKHDRYADKSREELIAKIAELENRKKYGLVWEDDHEAIVAKCKKESPVLREIVSKEIVTDPSLPTNLLIEGDNYHSLSVLNYTHRQKVDIIYIDPPYNTGAEEWQYNDRLVNKEDGFRHSKWLSMMEKRLQLAKNLLSDKGVIFISIDDNEQAHLKMLMDDIFGEKNFVGNIIWRKKAGGGQDSEYFANEHEYILCYRKNKKFKINFRKTFHNEKDYPKIKNGRKCKFLKLEKWGANSLRSDRRTMYYSIKDPDGNDFYPHAPSGEEGNWRTRPLALDLDHIHWERKKDEWKPYEVIYFDEISKDEKIIKERTIFYDITSTRDATEEQKEIFGKKKMDNTKPIDLMIRIITLGGEKNSTILDFFAGSGTTGHAVLELNKEDGGSRQFILCTNNENQIAEKITHRRIQYAIEGYTGNSKTKKTKMLRVDGLGGNLKYYKVAFVLGGSTDPAKRILSNKAVEMLCIRENTFQEVKTDNDKYKIYRNDKQHSVIVLDDTAIAHCKKEIAKIESQCIVYQFSLSSEPDKDAFAEFGDRVQVKPIPEAILQIYRRIFR